MTVTETMVERALAVNCDQVQGFFYRDRTEPHVIRDFADDAKGVELWSGTSHEDMMHRIEFIKMQRALTAALSGQVVVPVEPTPEMLVAGRAADEDCDMPGQVYRAMISAAPSSLAGDGRNG